MKKQQWNGVKATCASSQPEVSNWTAIEWDNCKRRVRKLQARIVKAQKEKRYNRVKVLQRILVTSFDAKMLAVRRVTSNKGKRTAGVDKVKWTAPTEVYAKIDHILVGQLKRWAFRRHSNKSKRWVLNRYFKSVNNRKWIFKDTFEKKEFTLKKLADIPITRHIKIRKDANPFDPQWDAYFDMRGRKNSKVRSA